MKKIISMILCFVIIITSLVGCGNNEEEFNSNNKIKIVTTNYVLADFARQIGGENVEVEVLLNSNENSLTHVATNKDIAKINESDIFIYNGYDAEPWVYDVVDNLENGNILIINAADGVNIKSSNYNINKADDKDYILNSKNPNYKNPNADNNTENNNNGDNSNSNNNTNNGNEDNKNTESSNSSEENKDSSSSGNQNSSDDKENTNNNSGNNNNTENNSNNGNNNEDNKNTESSTPSEEDRFTIGDLLFSKFDFSLSKFNKSVSLEGKTSDGYSLKNLPEGYGISDEPCFGSLNNAFKEIESSKSLGIFNGTSVSVFKKDDFYGNKFICKYEKISDINDLDNIYFDSKSYEYINNLIYTNLSFEGLAKDSKLDSSIDNQKAISLILSKIFSNETQFYCLYNENLNKPELFNAYPGVVGREIFYVGTINNPTDILDYTIAENKIICDSKSYSFFNSSNRNATTETQKYYNYWMDIDNAKIMVENIYNGIVTKNEENKDYFLENYNNYIEMLDSLDLRYKKVVENSINKFIILTGEFNCYYLLRYLGLDYMSIYDFEHQAETPTIVRQSNIVDFINNNKDEIEYVITEGDSTITETICKETDLVSLEINSLTNIARKDQLKEEYSYLNIMENNYLILKTALN